MGHNENYSSVLIKIIHGLMITDLFSLPKCKAMHFNILPGLHLNPILKLDNHNVEYCREIKFLELTWDEKLTWKPHVVKLKEKCLRTLHVLKSITTPSWGGDQLMTMRVFRSITRSILDYGAIIYGSTSDTNLKLLETITTEALRLAAGAFKTTPTNSLYISCNEMPPDIRSNYLSLVYYYKIRSQLSNPAFKHVVQSDTDYYLLTNI